MNEVELSPLMLDLAKHIKEEGNAAEDLRQAVNGIICRYNLHASVVVSLLARLSAAFIHVAQYHYNELGVDEVVEEDFQNFLTATLTDLDMSDVKREMDKIKKENLN